MQSAETACAVFLEAGHTCATTWFEACGVDHPLGAEYNRYSLSTAGCSQCPCEGITTLSECQDTEDCVWDGGSTCSTVCAAVDEETRCWEEGKCLWFDDSFEHEVWNQSEENRLVLICDMWHPDLNDDEHRRSLCTSRQWEAYTSIVEKGHFGTTEESGH